MAKHRRDQACASCAFRDPEAWVDDPAMGHKLINCLRDPQHAQFFCHEGLPQGGTTGTTYLVPTNAYGQPDVTQLTPCGGFVRWAVRHRLANFMAKYRVVMALQLTMCRRYLAGTFSDSAHFRTACDGRADLMQQTLNEASMSALAGDD